MEEMHNVYVIARYVIGGKSRQEILGMMMSHNYPNQI